MGKRFNVLSPVIVMRRGGRRKEGGSEGRNEGKLVARTTLDDVAHVANSPCVGVFQRNLSKDGRASAKTNGCNGYRCSVEASDSRRCVSRQTQRNT